jgi:penicillin-insensitive murein DD-endopeptidase
MVNGHSSHQIGLDVDIWLTPTPDRILTTEERENMVAVSMLKDPFTVGPDKWTPLHTKLTRGLLSRGGAHLCASSDKESLVRTGR